MQIKTGPAYKVNLDKATINIAIPEECRARLLAKVNTVTAALKKRNPKFKNKGAHGYKTTFNLPLGNLHELLPVETKSCIHFQLEPWDTNKSFMRIELNGHPYSKEQYKCIAFWLEQLLGEFGLDHSAFKVTRFDIAVDVLQPLSRLAIDNPASLSSGKFFDPVGAKSTFYIGTEKSPLQICCYERDDDYRTRIEFRFRQKVKLPLLLEDSRWQASFAALKVYDMDKVKAEQKGEFAPWLLAFITASGLKAAMSTLPVKERKKLTQMLSPAELEVYSAKKVQAKARRRVAWLVAALTNDFSALELPDEKQLERSFDKEWAKLTTGF